MSEETEKLSRRVGKSMSRRRGQRGYVATFGNWYYVQFWADVPGEETRRRVTVRLGRVSGPEKITKTQARLMGLEVVKQSGVNTPEHLARALGVTNGVLFREQAVKFLEQARSRKRRPVKPATLLTWESCLAKHLNPMIGDTPLWRVNNSTLKAVVAELVGKKLSPKSVRNYIGLLKMVVASAKTEDGEEVYPRKWNDEFADVPLVGAQRTPTLTTKELQDLLKRLPGQYRTLVALLAGTGMRVGEALGLEVRHLSDDCRVIRIEQSVWRGEVQTPKTANAFREVDLCSELASKLQSHLDGRSQGFVFGGDRPLGSQSSILKNHLHPALRDMGIAPRGFHSLRRFRITVLRKACVPEDLIRWWSGHSSQSITDCYSQVSADRAFRAQYAEEVGLGFALVSRSAELSRPQAP